MKASIQLKHTGHITFLVVLSEVQLTFVETVMVDISNSFNIFQCHGRDKNFANTNEQWDFFIQPFSQRGGAYMLFR